MKAGWIAGLAWLAGGSVVARTTLAQAPDPSTAASPETVQDQAQNQASPTPAPPWPRRVTADDTTLTVYEPQAEKWTNDQLQATSAVAVRHESSDSPSFGAVHFTARTDVDKEQGLVSLHDIRVTGADFPKEPNRAAVYQKAIENAGELTSVVALARLQAGIESYKAQRQQGREAIKNTPPRIIVSDRPSVLVLVDGAPVLRRLEGTSLSRVVNTRPLLLRDDSHFYLRVADRWVQSATLDGPWSEVHTDHPELDRALDAVTQAGSVQAGQVDLLNMPNGELPQAVYVSTRPAEIVETSGRVQLAPIANTDLWYATNTNSDLLLDNADKQYYVRLSGRWFHSKSLDGPWEFTPPDKLPGDFARIPSSSAKANVLASVPGTTEAKEAVIANQIPETASVPRQNGPTLQVAYDGVPRFSPIEQTSLSYATNTATPVIQVDRASYYALSDGVWFASTSPEGPWVVATSVPPSIYTIPTSSPLHYATYVYVDGSTPNYVYEAASPGYLGAVVAPSDVVVYGTGYAYPPWVGTTWYGYPATFGFGASLAVGVGFGFGFGTAYAYPWWGYHYYHPYPHAYVYPHPAYAYGHPVPYAYPRPYVNNVNIYNRWYGRGVVARPAYAPPVRAVGGGPPVYRVAPAAPGYRPVAPGPGYRSVAPAPAYRSIAPAPAYRPAAPGPAYHPVAPAPAYRPAAPPAYHFTAPPAYRPAPMWHGGMPGGGGFGRHR